MVYNTSKIITSMIKLQVLTSQINDTFVPSQVLDMYYELESRSQSRNNWKMLSEDKIWEELCFCILSANVSFELAKSTIAVLSEKGLLDHDWLNEDGKSSLILFHEMDKSLFLPLKKNGGFRKYRYPKKRSIQIANAARAIYASNTLKQILSELDSDVEARKFFVKQISGIGIKEASHFLRNIGYSNSLAIIDVHVLAFLKEFLLVDIENQSLTLQQYVKIEKILKNFVEHHNLDLGLFDLAVWYYMKNRI